MIPEAVSNKTASLSNIFGRSVRVLRHREISGAHLGSRDRGDPLQLNGGRLRVVLALVQDEPGEHH